ncbi:hypothetical protein K3495_g6585 [Podosphaera aphanis]|nr:hypothetical protein K3495_g6585 [Podosphaera aphanis]
MAATKVFTSAEVATHKDASSRMLIIIDDGVYDITDFIDDHPGGSKILSRVAGKDSSRQFWKYHNEGVMNKYAMRLKVGEIGVKAKL